MLAHSPPRPAMTSESDMRKALSMGMDLSPSQLVTHPTQLNLQELQSLVVNQNNPTVATGLSQVLPLEQQLLQSLAAFDFGKWTSGVLPPAQPQLHSSELPAFQQSTFPSTQSISPLDFSSAPASGMPMETVNGTMTGISQPQSSSTLSDPVPQVAAYSRNDGAASGSPKSAPIEIMSFGRLNNAARQRTAQACEKCRDRKTKCSGNRPTCQRCADRGLQCVWASDSRLRGSSKPTRQSRFSAGDNIGEPLAMLPVPLSEPSSQTFDARDYVRSAPAIQTTFPDVTLPSHLPRKDQQKRQSWNEGTILEGHVSRGVNALSIMGEPILPLNAYDDCWGSVEGAFSESQARDRSTTIRARERSNSASVAHLAHARSLRDEDHEISKTQVPALSDYLGDTSTMSYSSPLPFGTSSETPESDSTVSQTVSRNSTGSDNGLHQPHPSCDAGSQLSEDMMQLLNFPSTNNLDSLQSLPTLAEPTFEILDINKSQKPQPVTIEAEDELFAQYFDAAAFESQNMRDQ